MPCGFGARSCSSQHVLASPRIKLYTDYERELADKDLATFRGLVQRAAEHEPIAYLTGKRTFLQPGILK